MKINQIYTSIFSTITLSQLVVLPETSLLRTFDWWLWTPVVSPAVLPKASSAPSAAENRETTSVLDQHEVSHLAFHRKKNSFDFKPTGVRNRKQFPKLKNSAKCRHAPDPCLLFLHLSSLLSPLGPSPDPGPVGDPYNLSTTTWM